MRRRWLSSAACRVVLGHIHAGVHGSKADGAVEGFVGQKLPIVEVVAAAQQNRHGVLLQQRRQYFAQALVGIFQGEAGAQVAQVTNRSGAGAFL